MMHVTTTFAVANQKGGVAKTTTVASLAVALCELGQRVLAVDLDPQGSLTFSLGVDPEELDVAVGQVLLGTVPALDAIFETEEGPHLLGANIELTQAEQSLMTRTGREQRLRAGLEPILDYYDFIVIDCPPSLGVLTVGALVAADEVIIPLQAETLSHRGVGQLLDTIHDVRQLANPRLTVRGVLPTMYDGRMNHARAVVEAIETTYGLDVLVPPIPKTIRFAEAPAVGQTILTGFPSHPGAEAYRKIAEGLVD